jgi:GTP pyrophosphokinase
VDDQPQPEATSGLKDVSGSPPVTTSPPTPVDAVQHGTSGSIDIDAYVTELERELVGDLFAVVAEHEGEVADPVDRSEVLRAFLFACEHHADQRRQSGENFITHPVGVAKICAGMRLDTQTLCAALLHDTVEDTTASLDEVRDEFGDEIAGVVDEATKLTGIPFRSRDKTEAEKYRKLMVAMVTDFRVILIKLADRLHNMRTLGAVPKQKQIEKAKETLEIYAPLAHRLGIHAIKWELEELAFATLHPRKYQEIKGLVNQQREERERYVAKAGGRLAHELQSLGIQSEISGRAKHFYSIYMKMTRKDREFTEIYDLTAMRVIVDNIKDCYGALGVIHSIWKPLPGRFKDYVALPKFDLYQSLHTTVIGPEGRPLEIQVRTRDMHATAEYGVAAHWRYKENTPVGRRDEVDARLKWLRSLLDPEAAPDGAPKTLSREPIEDGVFAFTPKGEIKSLPEGAMPLDFAYEIHTEVGHGCVGARVNGEMVPLDYELQSGDIVEILTSKGRPGPNRESLALVKTSRARKAINAWLKAEDGSDLERVGRELLKQQLNQAGLRAHRLRGSPLLADVIGELGFKKVDDLYIALGAAKISAKTVVKKVLRRIKLAEGSGEDAVLERSGVPANGTATKFGIRVAGFADVPVRLAKCCRPVSGDPIVGHVKHGRWITIHHEGCRNVVTLSSHPERVVPVSWDGDGEMAFEAELRVDAWDRHGVLADVTRTLEEAGINIVEARCLVQASMTRNRFVVQFRDSAAFKSVINRLRAIDSVFDAYRVTPPMSPRARS